MGTKSVRFHCESKVFETLKEKNLLNTDKLNNRLEETAKQVIFEETGIKL